MSLVLGVAFANRSIIVSDGRARNSKTNLIIDEKCNKTRRINENVILGFSGALEFSKCVLENFELSYEKYIPSLKANDVAKILCKIAKDEINYLKKINESDETKFQMVITGINGDGVMSLYDFGVCNNLEIEEHIPKPNDLTYCVLQPGDISFSNLFKNMLDEHLSNDIWVYINLLFCKAASMDDSINTNLFIRSIEL